MSTSQKFKNKSLQKVFFIKIFDFPAFKMRKNAIKCFQNRKKTFPKFFKTKIKKNPYELTNQEMQNKMPALSNISYRLR